MTKKNKHHALNQPLLHTHHRRPYSRRDFLAQGLALGGAMVMAPPLFGLNSAQAALSTDMEALKLACGINSVGAGKIPFICFDLAGGASMAGTNVLIGQQGGQLDFVSTEGYNRMGLPGDMVPSLNDPISGLPYYDDSLGLAFHSDSGFLRGIRERLGTGTAANINGAVIPARSENDTGNNPHNPMYGIAQAGANGELLRLIGSVSSDSGGNSMSPAQMIRTEWRPTKVDRPRDVTGLVDTGKLVGLLDQADAVAVLESVQRISAAKIGNIQTGVTQAALIKDLLSCGYVKTADLVDRYGDPSALNPTLDTEIVGPGGIFSQAEFDSDREFRKTASVMKMVMNGYAGAGTITIGGYDYHTGERATGELRDLRAGRCMGACLEYAHRLGQPLMMYVSSDGSVFSNGSLDESEDGRGKGVWTGDSSATAASFFLVYNPLGRPQLLGGNADQQAQQQQIGYFRRDGSVETASSPAANNVNLLVETVILNYLALHGQQGDFETLFPNHRLGNSILRDSLTAFASIK
ncbi:MAG: general secretion pathway protein GspF [Gammaproteobacteria bacterium]|nr:general secretion pathway protein GspF [Gammaproteobacteria bacterium]